MATNSSSKQKKNSLAQDLTTQKPSSFLKISAVQSLAARNAPGWTTSHSLKPPPQMPTTERLNQLFLIKLLLTGLAPQRGPKAWAPNSFPGPVPILPRQLLVPRAKAKHWPCAWSRLEHPTCLHPALEHMNLSKTRHLQQAQAGRLDLQREMMLISKDCVQATSPHQIPTTPTSHPLRIGMPPTHSALANAVPWDQGARPPRLAHTPFTAKPSKDLNLRWGWN